MKTFHKYTFVFLFFTFIGSLTPFANAQGDTEKFVVVLDAGHGGKDSGNLGSGFKEKNIALKVTMQVGKALEQLKDVKVIYTRKTDVFLELHERAAIANKADADLFVSIHCNAHSSQAYGTETFVLATRGDSKNMAIAKKENEVIYMEDNHEQNYQGFDPSSPESLLALSIIAEEYLDQSIVLARMVEDNFMGRLRRKSRGVKDAAFWVLHNTYMPSVLIELGFLTNKNEGKFLNSKTGQTKMATQIKNAIVAYKNKLDNNIGTEVVMDTDDSDINTGMTAVDETPESMFFEGITFKVQISAGKRKLATKPYNFNGLSNITRKRSDKIYRYYFGATSDYNLAVQLKGMAAEKGYADAYIVAFKEGNQVPLTDILQTASN